MKPTDRFETVEDYINAHSWASKASKDAKEALASLCYKRNKIWYRVRECPKDPKRATAYWAYTDAKHEAEWGCLPSHKCYSKVAFFFSHPEEQERYSNLFDEFLIIAMRARATKRRKVA